MPTNILVYNQEVVLSLKKELLGLENEVTQNLKIVQEKDLLVQSLQEQLQPVQSQINGSERSLSQLDELQLNSAALQSSISYNQELIKKAYIRLDGILSEQRIIQDLISKGEQFLNDLNQEPHKLISDLRSRVLIAFNKYQEKHLVGISPQVRICFFSIEQKLATLIMSLFEMDPHKKHRLAQIDYLRICGFLSDMYHQVKLEGKDQEFSTILLELLESTHIAENGDLPDQMKSLTSSATSYREIKDKNASLFLRNELALRDMECGILNVELNTLIESNKKPQTLLQDKIRNASKTINYEIQQKTKNNMPIDYQYYTQIVLNLKVLLNNPDDLTAASNLGSLAEAGVKKSSISKIAFGSILAVLGIIIVVVNTALLLSSGGSSAVLSAVIYAFSLSLFKASSVILTGYTLSLATGVGLTFLGMNKLSSDAGQKIVINDLKGIVSEIEKNLDDGVGSYVNF